MERWLEEEARKISLETHFTIQEIRPALQKILRHYGPIDTPDMIIQCRETAIDSGESILTAAERLCRA